MRRRITRGLRGRVGLASGLTLALVFSAGLAQADWIDLGGPEEVAVQVLEDDGSRTVIEITVGGFATETVTIDGVDYQLISLPGEAPAKEIGLPQLPNVRRSVIIPDDREMAVRVLSSEYADLPDMPVAPSKGYLLRTVDPATVP